MIERDEEVALAARLPIVVGGRPVVLRTLNLEESEDWQAKLAEAVADFDLPDQSDPGAVLTAFGRQPARVMLELVEAYDLDHRLPQPVRKAFSQAELYAAFKQILRAEYPFVEDARSVAEAFGPQLRVLLTGVMFNLYQQAKPTSGPLPDGDSSPEPSAEASARSNGSSSGPTATGESAGKPRKP